MSDYEERYAQQQALKKLYNNMALFGRYCFPTALRKEIPPFHFDIYKSLSDNEQRRVAIAAPRGTAKSTTTSLIYPLWKAAFKRSDEDLFIVIISESKTQYLGHSETFKELFGDMGPETAKRWTNNDVILANGTRIIAVGTGQRVRGFIEGDTRPNLIIVDDFESELNAYTPEARAKNRKWMTEAVVPSLSDDGKLVMIGTVISEDCFLYWIKESSAWNVLWYSIWDDDEESIWPERFPRERILQRNGQGCLIREIDEEEKIIPIEVYSGVDPASSLSARADYFVIATIGIDNENNKYVLDVVRERLTPSKQPQRIIDTYMKYKPRRMKIETTGYQEALRVGVRDIMKEKGLYIPGLEKGVKPRTRKSERLLSLVPMFARKQFYWRPEDIKGQQEFLSYPRGKHDDVMDGVWTALDGAKPCRFKEYDEEKYNKKKKKKFLDWLTM